MEGSTAAIVVMLLGLQASCLNAAPQFKTTQNSNRQPVVLSRQVFPSEPQRLQPTFSSPQAQVIFSSEPARQTNPGSVTSRGNSQTQFKVQTPTSEFTVTPHSQGVKKPVVLQTFSSNPQTPVVTLSPVQNRVNKPQVQTFQAPQVEVVQNLQVRAPQVQRSQVVQSPQSVQVQSPQVHSPELQKLQVHKPQLIQTPQTLQIPVVQPTQTPLTVQIPKTQPPQTVQIFEVQPLQTQSPQTQILQTLQKETPKTQPPQTVQIFEVQPLQTQSPQKQAPQTQTLQKQTPKTQPPQTVQIFEVQPLQTQSPAQTVQTTKIPTSTVAPTTTIKPFRSIFRKRPDFRVDLSTSKSPVRVRTRQQLQTEAVSRPTEPRPLEIHEEQIPVSFKRPVTKPVEPTSTPQEEDEDIGGDDEKERLKQIQDARYSFRTEVSDPLSDSSITREEKREDGAVEGMYSYSDGFFRRTVRYRADHLGYRVLSEDVEPLGDGPKPDPKGRAEVAIMSTSGVASHYTVSASDIMSPKTAPKEEKDEQEFDL